MRGGVPQLRNAAAGCRSRLLNNLVGCADAQNRMNRGELQSSVSQRRTGSMIGDRIRRANIASDSPRPEDCSTPGLLKCRARAGSSSEADDQKRSSRFSLVLVIAGVACVRCSVQFDNIIASPGAKLGVRMRLRNRSRISAITAGSRSRHIACIAGRKCVNSPSDAGSARDLRSIRRARRIFAVPCTCRPAWEILKAATSRRCGTAIVCVKFDSLSSTGRSNIAATRPALGW